MTTEAPDYDTLNTRYNRQIKTLKGLRREIDELKVLTVREPVKSRAVTYLEVAKDLRSEGLTKLAKRYEDLANVEMRKLR